MDGTGAMAKSLAGHDKGEIFVIIEDIGEYVFLVDGKLRPAERPKRKSIYSSFMMMGNRNAKN